MIDSILQPLNQYQYVVARWDNTILNNSTTSAVEILKRIISLGYQVDVSGPVRFAPCPMDPDQFLVLKMASQAEARRICGDSENDGIVFDNTPISVVDLIGPRGVSLQNATDCMSIWHEQFDNDDLMELLLGMVQVNPPLKDQVIERDLHLIRKTFEAVIENASCQVFGSYASSVRKNGYSDIDLNVESIDTPEKPGSTTIRPLQQLVDDRTCLFEKPLTKAELYSFPPEDIIKALYRSFNRSVEIKKEFKLRYLPARTPIIVFTSRFMDGIFNVSFDISVNNRVSVQKAELLDWFMTQDCSKNKRTGKVMKFLVHWAKCNGLMSGAYEDEKLKTKTRFNSYIINQMVIHFIQAHSNRVLVHPQTNPDSRVVAYNFDELFTDYPHFLREFFKYFANFDFANMAIYGKHVLQKKTVSNVHRVAESPLMIMDPMDYTHNLTAQIQEDAVKLFNGLIRNALLILKQKIFRISLLLRTNETAKILMDNKDSHTSTTLPTALQGFGNLKSSPQEYLTFQLPESIQTSPEFMTLLTRVLRFEVSPGQEVDNLYNSMGVVFAVYAKTWIGRRNIKRQIKNEYRDLSNLKIDVLCSDAYQYEKEPIAELRMAMSDLDSTTSQKIVYVEILKGNVNDVKDAMHYLIDHFMVNNQEELAQDGIMSVADVPRALKSL